MYKPNSQPDNSKDKKDKKSEISFKLPSIPSIDTSRKNKPTFPIGGPIGK